MMATGWVNSCRSNRQKETVYDVKREQALSSIPSRADSRGQSSFMRLAERGRHRRSRGREGPRSVEKVARTVGSTLS